MSERLLDSIGVGRDIISGNEDLPELMESEVKPKVSYRAEKGQNFSVLGSIIDRAYQEVIHDMRLLVHNFNKKYSVRIGMSKGYSLHLTLCGNKNCNLCPHGIHWRRYEVKRKNPYLDTVADAIERIEQTAPSLLNPSFDETLGSNVKFMQKNSHLIGRSLMPSSTRRRRTYTLFVGKRMNHLPPAFYRACKDKAYLDDFLKFNEEMKRLNRARKKFEPLIRRIRGLMQSIHTSNDFKRIFDEPYES